MQVNKGKPRNKKTQEAKFENQRKENEDIFFVNYLASREASNAPRARAPNANNQQIDAVSVSNGDSGDESQDEATTAMLDEAATRYYESIATGSEDADDSEVESTIYDLGNDTQFAFEPQEPKEGIRERCVERTSKKREITSDSTEGRDKFR